MGFEPTPPMETRNLVTLLQCKYLTLESGALDRSAILTAGNAESTKSFNSALLIPVEQDKFHYRDQLKN